MKDKSSKTNGSNDKRSTDSGKDRHTTALPASAPTRVERLKRIHRSLGSLREELSKLTKARPKTAAALEAATLAIAIALRLLRGRPLDGVRLSVLSEIVAGLKLMLNESDQADDGGQPETAQPEGDPSSLKPKTRLKKARPDDSDPDMPM
jgi:hypothetical protein